jgi:hypothetical protein
MGWTVSLAALAAGLLLGGVAAVVAPRAGAGAPGDLAFGPDRSIGQPARNPSSPFLRMGPDGRLYAVWTEDDPTPSPQPKPAADPAHRGHWMITFDMRVVLLASSGDGGATWTAPRRVNSVTEAAQGEENDPKVAFAPDGRALVAWSVPSEKGDKSRANVRLAMEDGKGGFTPSRTLNEVPNAARFPLLEQAPDNTFLLAWIDRRVDNPTPRALYVRRISGSGQELGRSYKVGEDACDCCRLGVAFADQGRTVYLVHREVGKEQVRNHVLRKSTDGGITFGAPVTISDDGWQTGCPHSGPAIAVDRRGQLHVTWFTVGRAPGEAGVYYAVSRDGGRTFAPRVLVQANTAPEILHTTLAVDGDGTVHFAWDNLDERSRSQVFVRSLAPDGTTWTPAQRISAAKENARRPALALSNQALHVAWTETEGETSRVVLRSASLKR